MGAMGPRVGQIGMLPLDGVERLGLCSSSNLCQSCAASSSAIEASKDMLGCVKSRSRALTRSANNVGTLFLKDHVDACRELAADTTDDSSTVLALFALGFVQG